MKTLSLLIALAAFAAIGPAAAETSGGDEPSPAFSALIGSDLETLVRHQSILTTICDDTSLEKDLVGRSMILHVRQLGTHLNDVRNSEELTWLTNAYYLAYSAGMKPMVGLLEKKSPGFTAQLCRVTRDNALRLLKD